MPSGPPECDPLAQLCPEGEKCMPWSSDGGSSWNSTKCTPVGPDAPGEPCTVEGSAVSGFDSCEKGAMCWEVDPETLEGVCISQCQGPIRMPSCPQGTHCRIHGDAVLNLCLPNCDPLLQDCPDGDLCMPDTGGYSSAGYFSCGFNASGESGFYGDACEFANDCAPGLFCLNAKYIEGCKAGACCTPWCDTSKPLMCPGDTQECIPWYEGEDALEEYENLGICGIPQ